MAVHAARVRVPPLSARLGLESVASLLDGAERLGFPFFLYCVNPPGSGGAHRVSAPQSVLSRGLSEHATRTWQQTQHEVDPVRHAFLDGHRSQSSALPVVWENRNGQLSIGGGPLTPEQRDFMQLCYSQGVRTGLNIPIHLDGQLSIVSFFSDVALDRIRRLESKTARLFLLGHRIHSALGAQRTSAERVHLSPRELECMRWVAKGKNATEIALILGISVLTARDYLKSVSVKLNTSTRAQALARLLSMGYLDC